MVAKMVCMAARIFKNAGRPSIVAASKESLRKLKTLYVVAKPGPRDCEGGEQAERQKASVMRLQRTNLSYSRHGFSTGTISGKSIMLTG